MKKIIWRNGWLGYIIAEKSGGFRGISTVWLYQRSTESI
jgi:hypothetical protein